MKKKKFIMNTAMLTGSSLLMSCIGMAYQVWPVGRIGAAGIGLYQLVWFLLPRYGLAAYIAVIYFGESLNFALSFGRLMTVMKK